MPVRMLRVVGDPVAVRHPETGQFVVPDRTRAHRSDDPIVEAYPWMFGSDDVEQATAAPGERRTVRR